MARAFIRTFLILILLCPTLAMGQAVEQIYLADNTSVTAFDVSSTQNYLGNTEIINQGGETYENLYYDEINERLFYVALSGIKTLRYVYRHQVDFESNENQIVSRTGGIAYSVDGTRDVIVLALDDDVSFHIGLVNSYSTYTIESFPYDTFKYASVRDVSMAPNVEYKFYFSTNDDSMSKPALLFRYDPDLDSIGTPKEIVVDTADMNTADHIYYDPKNHILYTMGDNQFAEKSLYAYHLDEHDNVASILKSDYDITELYALSSFVLRYVSGTVHFVLGSADPSDEDILEDYETGGGFRQLADLTVQEENGRFVYDIAIDRECNEFNVDSDGDSIPDCKDPCPADTTNSCNILYYLNDRYETQNTVFSHLSKVDGDAVEGRQAKEGFTQFFPDRAEIDTVHNVLLYTDASGHVRRVNLETHEDVQVLEESSDFVGAVTDITIDTFRETAYMAVDDGADNYKFYSFDYLDEDPTVSPSLFSIVIPPGQSIGGLVIDPRKGMGLERMLYFSMGRMIFGHNLDQGGSTFNVLDAIFTDAIGDLAINHNDGLLYFYSQYASQGSVFEVPLTGSTESARHLFIEQDSSYNAVVESVNLYYHSHIDNGNGRVYVSNDSNFIKPLFFYNVSAGSCDASGCVTDTTYFDGVLAEEVRQITFRESCDCSASLDSDMDGEPDCDTPGICGGDLCPLDPGKIDPGVCGCGIEDSATNIADDDGDGAANCNDVCPNDSNKISSAGTCGCGETEDADGDSHFDCEEECPLDSAKFLAGICGCGVIDVDVDGDSFCDFDEQCPGDPFKTDPGTCGCGIPDVDSDGDGAMSCDEACDSNADKLEAGACGCNLPDTDSDSDGVADCNDQCPTEPTRQFIEPCGCDATVDDTEDSDDDGFSDCNDACIDDPIHNIERPVCGCNVTQDTGDSDGDGIINCLESCADGSLEGCGCGIQNCDVLPDHPGRQPGNPGIVVLTELSALSNPPSQTAQGKRGIKLFLKKYDGVLLLANQRGGRLAERRRRKKNKRDGKLKVGYEIIIKKLGKKQRIKRIVTKKNVVRLNRLKKGTYSIRYKATIKRKKKTVSSTNFSPSSSFRVPLP